MRGECGPSPSQAAGRRDGPPPASLEVTPHPGHTGQRRDRLCWAEPAARWASEEGSWLCPFAPRGLSLLSVSVLAPLRGTVRSVAETEICPLTFSPQAACVLCALDLS